MTAEAILGEKLGRIDGGRVLDVATGAGGFLMALARNLRSYDSITGIDTDDKTLATARSTVAEAADIGNIELLAMDAAGLTFGDASFDTAAISNSLHHMASPGLVLSSMMRVLKPGGTFIVREMFRDDQNEAQTSHVLFHTLRAEIDTRRGIVHRRSYLRREVANIVQGLGLADLDLFELGPEGIDPMDAGNREHLLEMIDQLLARPADYDFDQQIKVRGLELKDHIAQHGFQPASQLMGIGRKPG